METFRSVSEELKQLSEERRNDAAAIAPSILEFETTRRQGLETKGAASLAAAGLIIAGLAVIVAGEGWIRYLAVGVLLYVISAVCSALYALTPAKRYVVTSRTAFEPDVTAELLTIARVNEAPTLAVSNLVTASLYDLLRAASILVFSIGMVIAAPSSNRSSQQPSVPSTCHYADVRGFYAFN